MAKKEEKVMKKRKEKRMLKYLVSRNLRLMKD